MRRALGAVASLGLAAALAGCGTPEDPRARQLAERLGVEETGLKVVVVGIDGATLSVIDSLLDAGELPHLGEMVRRGAIGPLLSEKPIRSPALWTTIATGRAREEHGIEGFTARAAQGPGRQLVNSTMRRTLNVWDIVGAAGRRVGVAGWWATWPAEPVRGWLVSDRLTRSRWSEWSDGDKDAHLTFPPELAAELAPLVVDPAALTVDQMAAIAPLSAAERREFVAIRRPVFGHALSVVKFSLANQLTYERVVLELLGRGQPDLTALFLIAADPVSHTMWHHHEPEAFDFGHRRPDAAKREAVRNIYRHNDAYLGELVARLDEDTVVLVVSDHGFQASGKLPAAKPAREFAHAFDGELLEVEGEDGNVTVGQSGAHLLEGVLLAAGPAIRPLPEGRRIAGATLRDVAPTVLALLGFPVPEDLPGRVLTEILEPEFLDRHPVRRIRSYEPLVDRDALRVDLEAAADDPERLEMLRSLGYIQ